jgi:FAD/FMN-containing dehydrogenase
MARTYLMTWVPKRRRWMKKYRGRMYAVSPRQLGMPDSKEASYQAANAWWLAKQIDIDALLPPSQVSTALTPSSEVLRQLVQDSPAPDLHRMVIQGHAALQVLRIMSASELEAVLPDPAFIPGQTVFQRAAESLEAGNPVAGEIIDEILTGQTTNPLPEEQRAERIGILKDVVDPDGRFTSPDRVA